MDTIQKVENKHVIYSTASSDTKETWQSFLPLSDPSYKLDKKLNIYFDGAEVETMVAALLQFQCPHPRCDYVSPAGWADLKKHAKQTHQLQFWYLPPFQVQVKRKRRLKMCAIG